MTALEYFNNEINKINARQAQARPYGEDTTDQDVVNLLATIANSLAIIADNMTGEDMFDDNG